MQEEIFKDVPGYEGIYQVSNMGRVKSLFRFKISAGNKVSVKERILSGRRRGKVGKRQYLCVSLSGKNFTIHQLVAITFLGHIPCGHKLVVDHINDNPLDNRLENLQIVTNRFNAYKTQGKYASKYKGVSKCHGWSKDKWRARARENGKEIIIGYFDNEEEAGKAYLDYIQKFKE